MYNGNHLDWRVNEPSNIYIHLEIIKFWHFIQDPTMAIVLPGNTFKINDFLTSPEILLNRCFANLLAGLVKKLVNVVPRSRHLWSDPHWIREKSSNIWKIWKKYRHSRDKENEKNRGTVINSLEQRSNKRHFCRKGHFVKSYVMV